MKEILWLCEQEIAHFGYPNLLGLAHREVVLTEEKVKRLRKIYREVLCESEMILHELVDETLNFEIHKLKHIT